MERLTRVLIVEDYAPFRRLLRTTLEQKAGLEIIGEASNGVDAIRKSKDLKPELILLDVGLPELNGIEVARSVRSFSSKAKILVVSENRSWEIIAEAFRSGADGYVIKSDAGRELLPAVESVLQGKRFISANTVGRDLIEISDVYGAPQTDRDNAGPQLNRWGKGEISHHAVFYSDDRWLLEDVAQFIGDALKAGNAAIVIATESHRNHLLPMLKACGSDVDGATEQGRYIALDAADTLSRIMLNGTIDPVRFMKAFGTLIQRASKSAKRPQPRIAVFGECVRLLMAEGNAEAAIHIERLANKLLHRHDIDILCGYSFDSPHATTHDLIYQQICAEHSDVHSH
jgi:CheY-like chemotaxis protein